MIKYFSVLCLVLFFSFNTVNAQNFSTHQVKRGETLESISKQYYVTTSQILELNPDAKKALKPNTILIIPISKSTKPKETITNELDGFREHTVQRKETLYSLSKEYNVSEEDIKKYNKSLYANPLRKGDVIQIPIYKTTKTVTETATTKPYIVLPKEGKWRVAYKFGISVEELEALNPKMGDTLQEGQQINVPSNKVAKVEKIDEAYSYYKVLPKEGFYRLKLKLGLEQDELEALNPDLKETGLIEGMVLKVPFSKNTSTGTIIPETEKVTLANRLMSSDTKRLAVLLPFRLNRVDFDSITDTKQSIKKDPYLNASLDFYSGILFALDSLKNMGISVKVDVFDTKHEVSEVGKIIEDNNFDSYDAVIGPLTTETFEKAASELKALNVPIISPIGTNLKLYDHVFQSRPADDLLKSKVINFVKSDSLKNNIVIVSDAKNQNIANELKREFNYSRMVFSKKTKSGADANYVNVSDLKSVLKPGKNYVFLETESEGFASNVTSILASLTRQKVSEDDTTSSEVILITTNFNAAFEGDEISNEHLSKLHFHFSTISKSYNETDHRDFIKKYETLYNITPDKRAVRGFDLTMDVILRLATSNDLFLSVNLAPSTEYVENKFAYKKETFGGYYNTAVYLVKYENLNLVEVKP